MINHSNIEEFYDPANYDLEEAASSGPRIQFYADLASEIGGPALDIACGSGLVALPIAAREIPVVGVDLARPMLAHALTKARQQGLPVSLIEADARQFHLNKLFPFIFITGNAFQAFLQRIDQERFLACVKRHLTPDGIFVFETRNPSSHDLSDILDEEEEWFTYCNVQGQTVKVTGKQHYDPFTQVMHWTTFRRWSDPSGEHDKATRIACRFTYPQELEALLHYNGFRVTHQYGDWSKGSLTPKSETILTICKQA